MKWNNNAEFGTNLYNRIIYTIPANVANVEPEYETMEQVLYVFVSAPRASIVKFKGKSVNLCFIESQELIWRQHEFIA